MLVLLGELLALHRSALFHGGHGALLVLFSLAVAIRWSVQLVPPDPLVSEVTGQEPDRLPLYSVIAPLYREAGMVPQLARALAAIDYPSDRLELIFALERDDAPTRLAVLRHAPADARIVFPAAGPRTKPHACNAALAVAQGEFVVVYDAEDRPHPWQLREAVARFRQADASLVCLQAPLRIDRAATFLQRQFALEYATLFDLTLPALARLGLPFPLGGTSNHFRRAALQGVGGWDACNVTEDADIGLRLGACGGRLGMLAHPTFEAAPPTLAVWRPQRTRWIKGHLQTWIVHMRRPEAGGLRSVLALQVTLGLTLASAVFHGPAMVLVAGCLLLPMAAGRPPLVPVPDATLLIAGWAGAAAAMRLAARNAGLGSRLTDLVLAPFYWALLSWAAAFAAWEFVVRPHHWNKTPHTASDGAERRAAAPVERRRPILARLALVATLRRWSDRRPPTSV